MLAEALHALNRDICLVNRLTMANGETAQWFEHSEIVAQWNGLRNIISGLKSERESKSVCEKETVSIASLIQ